MMFFTIANASDFLTKERRIIWATLTHAPSRAPGSRLLCLSTVGWTGRDVSGSVDAVSGGPSSGGLISSRLSSYISN